MNASRNQSKSASGPGEAIRALRKKMGLTLSDLSARTDLTVSALSKMEMGRISLSYDRLMMLSRALGVDIAQLIGPTPSSASAPLGGGGRRVVERAGDGRVIETQSYTHVYLATELLNKRATPLTGETNVRTVEEFLAEFGDLMRHPGEEFAFVLEGEIQFHTEIYAPVRLKVGDSVYFDSEMGHAYLKAADGPCRMVVVCIPRGGSDTVMETFASVSERNAAQATAGASATPAAPQMKVTRRSGTKHTPRRRS